MKLSHIFLIWISYYILILNWAHRSKKFSVFVDSIQSLMFFFFSLDHYNYAPLVGNFSKGYEMFAIWEIPFQWTGLWARHHIFSALPIDQVPEQEDAHVCKVKGRLHWTDRKLRYFIEIDDCWTRKTYIFLQLEQILIFSTKRQRVWWMSLKYMKIFLKIIAQNCLHWAHKIVLMNLLQLFSNK